MTKEEIEEAIEEIHLYVSSVYISGNTLNKDLKRALAILVKYAKENIKVLEQIKTEIHKKITFNSFNEGIIKYDDILEIIDKNEKK